MKAVVAQIVGRHAVLLTDNGTFVKVKDQRYSLGQQITFCQKRKNLSRPFVMAASLLIFFLGGSFLALERIPFSYVSIDVNPSFEYSLNWFDRVISLHAVNEDAAPIALQLTQNGVVNQPIETAIALTIKSLNDRQYFLDDAQNDVVIAVASLGLKDVAGLSGRLTSSAAGALEDRPLTVTAFQTDGEKVHMARQYHTTAGRLVIVENLVPQGDAAPAAAREEWLKKPVREILNHRFGKAQPGEVQPGSVDQAIGDNLASTVSPEEMEAQNPKQTDHAHAPNRPDAPKTTAPEATDRPDDKKDKPADNTPAPGNNDKPKNTQKPRNEEQGQRSDTPFKESGGGPDKDSDINKQKDKP